MLTKIYQKIEDMRITIEDLEALKELSDELEENHVETEKQFHEDLGSFSRQDFATLRPNMRLQKSRIQPSGNTHGRLKSWKKPALTTRILFSNSGTWCCNCRRVSILHCFCICV